MTRQLLLVHGRAQQFKDAAALKAEWIEALERGLSRNGLRMPIEEADIRFPYYGQTLYDLVDGKPPDQAADVIVRGMEGEKALEAFARAYLAEIKEKKLTDEQLRQVDERDVIERGVLNWEWVQTALKALDRFVPGASAASVALATHDVYKYLTSDGIRNEIDLGVVEAFDPGRETVVVGHSLGTVVSYRVLEREGRARGWRVPLYVTLGAPLGVKTIKQRLSPISHPGCVGKWFNAMDERDVVSLYPLDTKHFDVDPEIENKTDVDNHTDNRHGIAGYLDDPVVAKRIHDALVA